MTREPIVVGVTTEELAEDTRALLGDDVAVEFVVWNGEGDPPRHHVDILVPLHYRRPGMLPSLSKLTHRLVQSESIGFEGLAEALPPGVVLANASTVHDTATAEQALALILAAQRGLLRVLEQQSREHWEAFPTPGLADRRVLVLGYGGVGKAIVQRLEPFEVEQTVVASRARVEDGRQVHAIDELEALLPGTDILVIALPGAPETDRLVGDRALSLLPDGALVVNVGRGTVFDMDALVDHVSRGRIRLATDVVDPEPLPAGHPAWALEGAIIAPHVGGNTSAGRPRMARLLARQIERMSRGEEPLNVVVRT